MQQLDVLDAMAGPLRPGRQGMRFVRVEDPAVCPIADGVDGAPQSGPDRPAHKISKLIPGVDGDPGVGLALERLQHRRGLRSQRPVGEDLHRPQAQPLVAEPRAHP